VRVTVGAGAAFPVTTRAITDQRAADAEAVEAYGTPVAVWARGADRLVGYGVAARLRFSGEGRLTAAAERPPSYLLPGQVSPQRVVNVIVSIT